MKVCLIYTVISFLGTANDATAATFLSTPSKDLVSLGLFLHRNMKTAPSVLYPALSFHARSLNTVKLILEEIAPPAPGDRSPYRYIPLERASFDVFSYVIEHSGSDVSLPSVFNMLMGIKTNQEWLQKTIYVLEHLEQGISYNDYAVLRKVVEDGDVEMLMTLLMSITDHTTLPDELLSVAASHLHWNTVTYLLSMEFARKPSSIHHEHDVALFTAVCARQNVIVEALLNNGANPQTCALYHGWTSMLAHAMDMECIDLLVKHGLRFTPRKGKSKMSIADVSPIIVQCIDARLVTGLETCVRLVDDAEITLRYRRNWLGRAASYVGKLKGDQECESLMAISKLLLSSREVQVPPEILVLCHKVNHEYDALTLIPRCIDLSSYIPTALELNNIEEMKAIAHHPKTRVKHMRDLLNKGIPVDLLEVVINELTSTGDITPYLPSWLSSCVTKEQAVAIMRRGVSPHATFTVIDDDASCDASSPPPQCTVLHSACSDGRLGLLEALLEAGGDPNLSAECCVPLFALLNNNNISYDRVSRLMRVLFKHGANVNVRDHGQPFASALIKKYFWNNQIDELVMGYLIDAGLDPTALDSVGNPLPHQLALLGMDNPLRYLCNRVPGVVDIRNPSGYSALGLVLQHIGDLTIPNPPNVSNVTACLLENGAKEENCFPPNLTLKDLHWAFDDTIAAIPVSPMLCATFDVSPDAAITLGRVLNYFGFNGADPSHVFTAFRLCARAIVDPSTLAVDLAHQKVWRTSFLCTMLFVSCLCAKRVPFVGVYRDIVTLQNLTTVCVAVRNMAWIRALIARVKDKMSNTFPRLVMAEYAHLGLDADLYISPPGLLFSRCLMGDAPAVQHLLSLGVRPVSLGQYTVLHAAALSGDMASRPHDVIRCLKECGMLSRSLVDARSDRLGTALHVASKRGAVVAVRMLLDMGASTRTVDESGRVPLHKAAQYAHCNSVDVLMEADPESKNVRDKDGRTPLELFIRRRSVLQSLSKKHLVNIKSNDMQDQMALDTYITLKGDIRDYDKITSKSIRVINEDDGDARSAHSLQCRSTISSDASDIVVKDLFHVLSRDAITMKRVLSSGGLLEDLTGPKSPPGSSVQLSVVPEVKNEEIPSPRPEDAEELSSDTDSLDQKDDA